MTGLYRCPVDGCGYGPAPKNAVMGHYTGKSGTDGHSMSYKEAEAALGDPEGPDEEPGGSVDSTADPGGPGGENPAMEMPPKQERGGSPGGSDEVTLPCGCEGYDPAEAPDPPFVITCDTCGKRYRRVES